MLRSDLQGGSVGGFGLGGPGDGGKIAIEKYMKWNFAFFIGAAIVFGVAICTAIFWVVNFTFAPATFFSEMFLFVFGTIMLVLDVPMPHIQKHPHVTAARVQIYKFALFMTRFMGRGLWYMFLATMVFGSLWDTGINMFFGGVCTLYLLGLGSVALGKGFLMTMKLNKIREHIMASGYTAERFISRGQTGLTGQQFKRMVEEASGDRDMFKDDEVDYILNALSFQPSNDGQVTLEELQYWLQPGPPLMV